MGNKYTVKLLPRAYRDLDGIYEYIAETLIEPGIATKLVDALEEAIFSWREFMEIENPVAAALLSQMDCSDKERGLRALWN